MAKTLEFDDAARKSLERGVDALAERRQGDARPARAATSSSTRSGAPPRSPTTA